MKGIYPVSDSTNFICVEILRSDECPSVIRSVVRIATSSKMARFFRVAIVLGAGE
jgi:hypothetical protein